MHKIKLIIKTDRKIPIVCEIAHFVLSIGRVPHLDWLIDEFMMCVNIFHISINDLGGFCSNFRISCENTKNYIMIIKSDGENKESESSGAPTFLPRVVHTSVIVGLYIGSAQCTYTHNRNMYQASVQHGKLKWEIWKRQFSFIDFPSLSLPTFPPPAHSFASPLSLSSPFLPSKISSPTHILCAYVLSISE